jgi:hypothetical protein
VRGGIYHTEALQMSEGRVKDIKNKIKKCAIVSKKISRKWRRLQMVNKKN